ncbi:MAG: arylsulfatase [Planctomycetes bacterium]|nr:arylsulfatase [Planctomycetota bacterium]
MIDYFSFRSTASSLRRRCATCAILCLALLLGFAVLTPAVAADRPNIIYIMADDLGYGDLGCYGQQHFATPNIDRMAAEGLRFTQHYAGDTVCAPSRCALMTGLHTGHCYIRGNKEHQPIGQEPLPADTITVSKLLKQAGYATGMFGKWGLGYPGSTGDPMNQGFDEFFGYNCQRNAHNYYPPFLFHNRERIELDGQTYSHDLIMDHALQFIRSHQDGPFFCYMPVTIPHAAMHVPERYVAPFRKKFPQFEDTIGRYAGPEVKNPVAAFAGMMTKLDEDVGRVLDLLKQLKIDDQTLVLFTSDNGPHHEGGHQPEFFDSNGPLTGLKRSLTEGGIRVPFIARWPGTIKADTVTDHISAFWDFLPTACELAKVQPPPDIDGISYVPTLLGREKDQAQHEYLIWEFYEQGGKRAVRMGRWKGIQENVKNDPDGPIRLYDLQTDLQEQHDLSGEHPELVAKIRNLFKQAHTPSEIFSYR